MNTIILMPIFYMMLLTFSVAMLQTVIRYKAVNNGEHTPEEMFSIPLPLESVSYTHLTLPTILRV